MKRENAADLSRVTSASNISHGSLVNETKPLFRIAFANHGFEVTWDEFTILSHHRSKVHPVRSVYKSTGPLRFADKKFGKITFVTRKPQFFFNCRCSDFATHLYNVREHLPQH